MAGFFSLRICIPKLRNRNASSETDADHAERGTLRGFKALDRHPVVPGL